MSDEKDLAILSPTFYDKLDSKYREKLAELEKILKLEKSGEIAIDLLKDFFTQFMMPKEFWNKLFKLISDGPPVIPTPLKMIASSSHYHFFYDDYLGYVTNHKIKIYHHDYHRRDIDIEELCYPQKYLEEKFVEYEKTYASSFIPLSVIRTCKRMKSLYSKIKSVEENEAEWFKALKEVEDEEFFEHNIEYRIGSDLTNKRLWKMYIEYLKENNQEKLLQTYSKYCRFFLNDIEMIVEYHKALGDKKVVVPWKNTFDFEIYDQNYFDATEQPKITVKTPLTYFFNAENALSQRFPFKSNLMFYILKNANAYVLHNLFKCCKWFYLKNPVSICFKLEPNDRKVDHLLINGQSLSFAFDSFLPKRFEKLFISTNLTLTPHMFPHFISRIYRCTAKYISLIFLKLSNEEFNILIGHGNVEDLYFCDIKDSNNEFLKLENVFKMVPKIKRLRITSVSCTSKTSEILCELPFKNKIKSFSVNYIKDTLLEPNGFAIFMKKNISPNSEILLHFDHQHPNYIRNFKETVNDFIKENWKEKEDKPLFSVN